MKLSSLTPNIMVDDMKQSVAFYRDILGFKMLMSVPEEAPYDWCLLQMDDVEMMLQSRSSLGEEIPELNADSTGGTLLFYIRMDGLADYYKRIKDHVRIVRPPETTFYGRREFSIADNSGFVLTFSEAEDTQ